MLQRPWRSSPTCLKVVMTNMTNQDPKKVCPYGDHCFFWVCCLDGLLCIARLWVSFQCKVVHKIPWKQENCSYDIISLVWNSGCIVSVFLVVVFCLSFHINWKMWLHSDCILSKCAFRGHRCFMTSIWFIIHACNKWNLFSNLNYPAGGVVLFNAIQGLFLFCCFIILARLSGKKPRKSEADFLPVKNSDFIRPQEKVMKAIELHSGCSLTAHIRVPL